MMQTKIRHIDLAHLQQLWEFQKTRQTKNWMSTRSNLQQWNLMKYESYGVQHSAPAFKDHTYQPPHSLCTRKEVQKQNYAIWLIFNESTHKEDWFIAFLTWISCMNFTPETVKPKAWRSKGGRWNKKISPIGIHTCCFKRFVWINE